MKLECSGIGYGYGPVPAVDGISLAFDGTGLCLIVGPNGSGKSTFLRLLAGLITPSRGDVFLDSRRLSDLPDRSRARYISWMSQAPSNVPHWPVFDFVLSGRYPLRNAFEAFTREDRSKTSDILARLGVDHLAGRAIDALSGGELQLVRIARALVQETRFVLLDEPFGSLDIRHRAAVWNELSRGERLTIAVSHDLSMIGSDLKRSILIRRGTVLSEGPPAAVLTAENIRTAYDWTPPAGWTFKPSEFF